MSIFDCVNSPDLPTKPDQEIIEAGRKIDRILEEIKLFQQEAMSKFISTIEKTVAIQEAVLNNSLQYIRNIVDIQTSNTSNILTVNRESVSNIASQILTELIIQLNINGLPVGTEQELSRPIIVENQVNNYGQVSDYYLEQGQATGGFTSSPVAPIGGHDNNGQQIGTAIRPNAVSLGSDGNGEQITGQQSFGNGPFASNRDSSGQSQNLIGGPEAVVSSPKTFCTNGSQVVVLVNGSQFYGSVLGSLQNTLTPVIALTGQVTDVNVLNEANNILSQVPAHVVPPLVQSPTGSLLPVGETFPVDLTSPLAWEFYGGRNVQWRRQSVRWLGGNAESLLFPESINSGRELLDKMFGPED
jgi:hypothetical protein